MPESLAHQPPRVSIVMPCFNAAAHLRTSIASVQAQTLPDWELIVVDDGSIDSSRSILDALAKADARIRILQQSNTGAAAARNRGLAAVRAALTAFLDSDDTWEQDFLRAMVDALDRDPGAGIAYCGWQNLGLVGGRDRPYLPPDYEQGAKEETLLRSCPWPIHGVLVRTDLIRGAGCFDEGLSSSEDFDLWLRLGVAHRLVRVPRVLAYYHHHGLGQLTGNKARLALNHLHAQLKYLRARAATGARLGRRRTRELTFGELLQRGYDAYWRRDLPTARTIFRHVMRHGYGGAKDWLYMLPAWLPESWHRWLLARRER